MRAFFSRPFASSPFTSILTATALAAMTLGCASSDTTHSKTQSTKQPTNQPATPATPPTAKPAQTKTCTMQSANRGVLRLTIPSIATCTARDGALDLRSGDGYVFIWLAPGAKTVDEALPRVPTAIASEFKDFKTTSTTTLTIAGAPAKRLLGSGTEADDGDAGTADVIIFKAGPHIFIACTHGEYLDTKAQHWMMTLLQTAQVP